MPEYPFVPRSDRLPPQLEQPLDPKGKLVPTGTTAFWEGVKFGFSRTPIPALVRKLRGPRFDEDPDYDPVSDASERYPDLVFKYPHAMLTTRSREETDWVASELRKYEEEAAILGQSGPFGFTGMIAGGLVDPTILLPLVGAAGKAKAAKTVSDVLRVTGSTAWQTGAASAASSYLGNIDRPEHTTKDTIEAGLSGALLGALIGGGTAALAAKTQKALERGLAEMEAGGAHRLAVNESKVDIKDLTDPEGVYKPNIVVKGLVATSKKLGLSPVVTALESSFETARKIQGVLSDAGLVTKKAADGKVVAPAGTVENRMHRNFGPLAVALQKKDELYVKYATGKMPEHFGPERAGFQNMKAFTGLSKKMTIHQFEEEVVKAMANGGRHEIPEVAEAARAANEALKKIGYEAEKVGLIPEGTVDAWEKSGEMYIPLALDYGKILADPERFVQDLKPYIAKRIEEAVKTWSAEKAERAGLLRKVREDLTSTEGLVSRITKLERESAELRRKVQEEFAEFTRLTDAELTPQTLRNIKKLKMPPGLMKVVRDENGNLTTRPMTEAEWLETVERLADKIRRSGTWKEFIAKEKEIQARIKELRKFAPTPRQAERAEKTLSAAEEQAAKLVDRAARRVARFVEVERKNLTELSKLRREFAKLQKDLKKLQEAGLVLSDRFMRRMARAGEVLARKDAKEAALASDFWKEMEAAAKEVVGTAGKRALELGKRVARAEDTLAVDEKAVKARVAEIDKELEALDVELPPVDVVVKDGKIDVDETAEQFLKKIIVSDGSGGPDNNAVLRLLMTNERGSELARRAFRDVPQAVLLPWIHNDLSSMLRTYFRTVAGDIELKRTFGTVNVNKILEPLREERYEKLSKAKNLKERERINREFNQVKRALKAQILRVRGLWGLPADPDSWIQRFGEGLLHHNVSTKLGMVIFPSLGDIPKSMMIAGPTKFVRGAIHTLLSKLRKEAKGWDVKHYALNLGVTERLMATRLKQIAETADRISTAGPILQAERWIAGKSLTLTGLPLLNQWMKELAIATSAAFYNDAIKRLADKGPSALTKKELHLLTNYGIDRAMAQRIMREVRSDPYTYWDEFGNWFENTARWTDEGARMVYESMLAAEANRAVVTPGLEKPVWADASLAGKLVYQFRGYLFSSTQKILTAGMQHPDAAFAAMIASSMVVGAAQLWLRGQIVGGEFKARMEKWSYAKWLDEAIDQSGVFGVFTEANRLLQMWGHPVFTAQWWIDGSEQYPARYAGQNFWTALLGPSASLLVYDLGPLIGELSAAMWDPDEEVSAKVIRRGRSLTWFNNHLLFRHGFDILEESLIDAFDLPERKK